MRDTDRHRETQSQTGNNKHKCVMKDGSPAPERGREEEEEEEEEGLFKADAVNEEDPERDRATQV